MLYYNLGSCYQAQSPTQNISLILDILIQVANKTGN